MLNSIQNYGIVNFKADTIKPDLIKKAVKDLSDPTAITARIEELQRQIKNLNFDIQAEHEKMMNSYQINGFPPLQTTKHQELKAERDSLREELEKLQNILGIL